jgi:predicted Fe-Mo cluster-binding NifX family protein
MHICIPITEDKGLKSQVSAHFGSAPAFTIVDTDSGACRAIINNNQHHGHGMCSPLASLQGERIDSMIVGGIGMGALHKLEAAKIRVYYSTLATVEETVAAFKAGKLNLVTAETACSHHGPDSHGHGHDHPHSTNE